MRGETGHERGLQTFVKRFRGIRRHARLNAPCTAAAIESRWHAFRYVVHDSSQKTVWERAMPRPFDRSTNAGGVPVCLTNMAAEVDDRWS